MKEEQYIIVGNGPAGVNAAEALRARDSKSRIVLIGQEPGLPYSPTILPYYVSGKIKKNSLYLRSEKYWRDQKIELILGNGVASISPGEGKIFLKAGSSLPYDAMVLAQGGRPLVPGIPGLKEKNPLSLRTLTDAEKLRQEAKKVSKAIVLGAGLIGMQAAQALGEVGLSVEVVEVMDQILPGYFDRKVAGIIRKSYESHRVTFHTSTHVEEVDKVKGNYLLGLREGKPLTAPLLFVAAGVRPNIDLLEGSGIKMDRGILVDKTMATNIPNIYAAGDVAQADDFWGIGKTNRPILLNAADQGKVAAASVLGEEVAHGGNISMNLFHFFGNMAFSIGKVSPESKERSQIHQSDASGKYLKLVLEGDHLAGVMAVNVPLDPGVLLQLIRRRVSLGRDKREFLEKPTEMGRKLMCLKWR
jgi:phenylglyoxylate dehydrogenase epsilon subunit